MAERRRGVFGRLTLSASLPGLCLILALGAGRARAASPATPEVAKESAKASPGEAAKDPARGSAKPEVSKEAAAVGHASDRTKNKAPEAGGPKGAASSKTTAGGAKKADGTTSASGAEEPTGPITPPIKLSALREEMSRPPAHHDEHAATRAERERLERLAAEINKAREGLRQDTAKLEAMLAARDAMPSPVASSGTPSEGDGGEPAKKVPSPLDNLAKAIRGMKPEQAAPIISRVDRKLAADVLLRMPGADAGKVLGVCKPEVAAELAAEIASRAPRPAHAELKR